MHELLNRITSRPELCGGRPTVRGMRIRVKDVLDLLSSGLSYKEVLEELEDLEPEDIIACIMYASQKVDYPILHGENQN